MGLIWVYTYSIWVCLEKAHIQPIYMYVSTFIIMLNVSGIFLNKLIWVCEVVWCDLVWFGDIDEEVWGVLNGVTFGRFGSFFDV